jgi:hypothetical protein
MIGLLIALFALDGPGTPTWLIAIQAFAFGCFASFQYSSMNTLVYADISDGQTSMASTIASTTQQMSMSFGVAAASLAAAFFIPVQLDSAAGAIIHGIHRACLALGAVTILSTLLFRQLKGDDGANISLHKVALPAA